jgi:transglutaminase-like putative cysteine protease
MQLSISHLTRFEYDREVQPQLHLLYLRPRENPLLQVEDFRLEFTPNARVDWLRDDFDNLPARVEFSGPSSVLEINSSCRVTTSDIHPFDFPVRDYAVTFPFTYEELHRFNLGIYLMPPAGVVQAALIAWLKRRFEQPPSETVAWLAGLNRVLCESLEYRRRDAPGIQTSMQTIRSGTGTCRDYAVLLIEIARTFGLAARFVSGYMYDAQRPDGGDMHAWVEVFLPGAGWRGLDPTHGVFCHNAYVPVAHAVLAQSVNPVQGSFFSMVPAAARLTAHVRVGRTDAAAVTSRERW